MIKVKSKSQGIKRGFLIAHILWIETKKIQTEYAIEFKCKCKSYCHCKEQNEIEIEREREKIN